MIEISVAYFMPIFAFLLVFILVYALLGKTKILGENKFLHLLLAFFVSIIFVSSPAAKEFVFLSVPWLAVFLVSLVLILMTIAFIGIKTEKAYPAVTAVVVIFLIVVFLISSINVFGPVINPYLPHASEAAEASGVQEVLEVKHFFFSPAVLGAILLFAAAAVVSWILAKTK